MRLNPRLSGYMWWLLQDYWTGSNGLLDTYFRAKSIRPALVRQFNSPAVLLQNGLPPTCSTEQPLRTKLLLSNYSPSPIRDGLLKWTVKLGDRVLAKSSPHQLNIGQGELAEIAAVELTLPAIAQPQKLTLEADLKTATLRAQNDWSAWVYPAQSKIENQKSITFPPLYAARPLLPLLQHLGAQPLPQESPLPAHAVFVVRQPTLETLAAVETGASLICLAPQELFPTVPNRFKPAWWLGSPNDCNAGTVVYPHPVTRAIAPDGWCDLGWYHLLEGAQAVVLDHFPAQPAVLVRGLDVHTVCRSKALLFEARVGDGSLIVSGLRLEPAADAPESAWLLDRLIEYAGTFPQPQATLPAAFLRQKLSDSRQQP